ncbi:hypothetical protein KAR28_01105 [Candidatus Parcubacteria bacterium]|nr:hypothetical protein [Candidatus Parcubacteria bacterium]
MKMKNVEIGSICAASGTRNFFGEGWPYHIFFKAILWFFGISYNLENATFISKTGTIQPRPGNMLLKKGSFMPKWLIPDCIKFNFWLGVMLNAVGLTNPGIKQLLKAGRWQKRIRAFGISFTCMGNTFEEKLEEVREFACLLRKELPFFLTQIFIQFNVSCTNTEHATKDMLRDSIELGRELKRLLNLSLDLKVNLIDADLEFVRKVERSGVYDCITCTNTLPWGSLPQLINWVKIFGTEESPLRKYGGGGLSGWLVFPLVLEWLRMMRTNGVKIPLKISGGIMNARCVVRLKKFGADAVEIGTVSVLRPFRVERIIKCANIIWRRLI